MPSIQRKTSNNEYSSISYNQEEHSKLFKTVAYEYVTNIVSNIFEMIFSLFSFIFNFIGITIYYCWKICLYIFNIILFLIVAEFVAYHFIGITGVIIILVLHMYANTNN